MIRLPKISIILFFAVLLRLVLAYFFCHGFDPDAWNTTADLVLSGKNPYVETIGIYSFSPLWMIIITVFKVLQLHFYLPVIAADGVIVYLLYKRTRSLFIASLYAFNPISLYVTSLDGNFDSLMVLFLLLSYIAFRNNSYYRSVIFFTIAVLFKQAAFLLLPAFVFYQQTFDKKIQFVLIPVMVFVLSLLPFYIYSPESIINNVFLYHGGGGFWGYDVILRKISPVLAFFLEKYAAVLIYILMIWYYFFYKKRALLVDIVLLFIGFYFFKSVGGAQYFLWLLPFVLIWKIDLYTVLYIISISIYLIYAYLQASYFPNLRGVGLVSLPAWIVMGFWFLHIVMMKYLNKEETV